MQWRPAEALQSNVGAWPRAGLTLVVGHKFLQAAEGAPRGDVEASTVQGPDLIMLHRVPVLGVTVSNRQRVTPCISPREARQNGTAEPWTSGVSTLTSLRLPGRPLQASCELMGTWANAQIVKSELRHGAAWVLTPGLPFSAVSPSNDYMAFRCLSFLTCKIRVAVPFCLTVPSDRQK